MELLTNKTIIPKPLAGSANAPYSTIGTLLQVGVLKREFVTAFAMGFASMFRTDPFSAKHIFSLSYRLDMEWVRAISIATKMVKRLVIWNWADNQKVGHSMGHDLPIRVKVKASIAQVVNGATPRPALVFSSNRNLAPETSLNNWRHLFNHECFHRVYCTTTQTKRTLCWRY